MFKAATMVLVLAVSAMVMSADSAQAGGGMRHPPAPLGKIDQGMRKFHKGPICKRLANVVQRQRKLGN